MQAGINAVHGADGGTGVAHRAGHEDAPPTQFEVVIPDLIGDGAELLDTSGAKKPAVPEPTGNGLPRGQAVPGEVQAGEGDEALAATGGHTVESMKTDIKAAHGVNGGIGVTLIVGALVTWAIYTQGQLLL